MNLLKRYIMGLGIIILGVLALTGCDFKAHNAEMSIEAEKVMYVGAEYDFTIALTEGSFSEVEWSIDNTEVAKIEGNKIVPLKEGSFNLVAKMGKNTDVIHINVYIPAVYQITYVLDGGEGEDLLKEFDRITVDAPVGVPTKLGYEFLGFYDNPEFEGQAISSVSGSLKGDITLYAKWNLLTIAMQYELAGGQCAELPATRTVLDEEFVLPQVEKDGYEFGGWYDNAEFSGEAITSLNAANIMTNKLYAKLTALSYALSYELNGGENGDNPESYTIEDEITLANPTKEGYQFDGWMLGNEIVAKIEKGSMGDKTLVATWSVIDYPIAFELNGGTTEVALPTSRTIESAEFVLPELFLDNYSFEGWYASADFSGEKVVKLDSSNLSITKLYAKFISVKVAFIGEVGYASIGEALAAAADGDTITILAGEYEETLTIEKGVTLAGPNAAKLGKEEREAEAIIKAPLTIAAAGVTLKGLRFEGTGTITVNADGATIENCHVQATAINPGANNRKGMIISNVSIKDLTIRGNYLYCGAYLQGPIDLCGLASNVVIDNNVFTNGVTANNNVNEGLLLYNAAGELTITNNDFLFPTDNWAILVYGSTLAHVLVQDNVINTANGVDHTSGIAVYNTPATCVMDFIHNKFYSTTGTTFRFTGGKAGTTINFYYNYFDAASPVKFNCLATAVVNFEGDCYGTAINTATNLTPTDYVEYASYNLETMEAAYLAWLHPTISYDLAEGAWGEVEGQTELTHGVTYVLPNPVREGYTFLGWYEGEELVTECLNRSYVLVARWEKFYPVKIADQGYDTIEEALAAAVDGDVIVISAGTYDFASPIAKSVTLLGAGQDVTTLNVAKEAVTIKGSVKFQSLTLVGIGATSSGVYFQALPGATKLSFEDCHITKMNTFTRAFESGTTGMQFEYIDNNFDLIGQFILWTKPEAGVDTVTFTGNYVKTSTCLGITSSLSSLIRVRSNGTVAHIYDNVFDGPFISGDGICENGGTDNVFEVRFNTFINLNKYVHNNGGKPIVFNNNLYLDADGAALAAAPAALTGVAGVIGDEVVYATEEERAAAYLAFLSGPTIYTISYDLAGGAWGEVSGITELEAGVEYTLPEPTKEGATFLGWYEGETKVEVCADKSYILVAKWEEIGAVKPITIGDQGFNTIAEALAAAVDGDVIELAEGTFEFNSIITKSVSFKGAGQDKSIIEFTQADNYDGLQAANISFESLTLKGRSANGSGTYFEIKPAVKKFSVKDCHVTMMNSFVKAHYATTDLEIEFVGNNFDNIGQFILWTKVEAGISSITFTDNYVQYSSCLGIENGASSLLRVRSNNVVVHIYHNVFEGAASNGDGICENGAANNEFEVRFNTFKNVNRFVHNNGGNAIIFNNNLYLDAEGAALASTPAAVSGIAGVVADEVLYATQEELEAAYLAFLNGGAVEPENFTISYDLAGGAWGEVAGATELAADAQYTLPNPVREGYTFLGWYEGETKVEVCQGRDYQLVAQWEEIVVVTYPVMIGEQGYETIAAALAAAVDGDVIVVADGEYAETLTISKEVTIQGTHHDSVLENAAVIKGVLTIAADNVTLKDLAFTGAARVKSTTNDGLTFIYNYVHDTDKTTISWVETSIFTLGFLNVAATNDDQAENFVISYNVFDKVQDSAVSLGRVDNALVSHNEFTDFLYEAIRIDGGYNDGNIIITNNLIKQTENAGYMGIFMRSYGGHQGLEYPIIYIAGNQIENVGYASTSANFCGAIGLRNYQEYGVTIIIRDNDIINCKNTIRLRNNATAANHAAYAWSAVIEHNNILGMPQSYLYNCKTGSDGDSTNPQKAIIGANFYGDVAGNKVEVAEGLIKDYAALAAGADQPFEHGVVADEIIFVVTVIDGEEEHRYAVEAFGDFEAPALTKLGFDFVGLYTNPNFSGEAILVLEEVKNDAKLYAKFEQSVYEITYELNGGSFVEGAEVVASGIYGQEVVLPTAEKEGMEFTGWVLEGSSEVITSITLEGPTTVVATFARPVDDKTLLVGADKTYQRISDALEHAVEGSTIIVDSGSYTEDVVVTVSNITILGANEGINAVNGSRVAETILSGSVVVVEGVNNVTFDGFTFTSPEAFNMLGNNDSIALLNNIFEASYTTAGSSANPKMQVANSGAVSNFKAQYNKFILHSSVNYTCNIAFKNEVNGAQILDNYFTNDGPTTSNPFAVWFFNMAGHIEINNNNFDRFAGDYWTVWGGSESTAANTVVDFKDNLLDGRSSSTCECGISFNNLTAAGIEINIIGNKFINVKDTIIGIVGSGASDSTSTPTVKIMYNAFVSVSARMKFNCASTNFEFSNNYLSSTIGNYTDQGTPATKVNEIARDGYNSLEEVEIAYQNYLNGIPNEYININYVLDGGTVTGPNKFVKGSSFTLGTPSKEDYRFLGWTLTENGTEYITVIPKEQAEDVTVYANWEKIVSSTVVFDFNGGYSEELFLLDVADAPHYAIDNYNYNEGTFWGGRYTSDVFIGNQGSDPKATFSDRIYIGKDVETGLYKILSIIRSGGSSWADGAEYVISISNSISGYYANYSPIAAQLEVGMYACFSGPISSACKATPVTVGFFKGQPTNSTITKKVTSADTLDVPSRLGFEFDGWFDANNKKYSTVFDIDGDVTLIAHWTEKNPVTEIVIDAETAEMLTDQTFQFVAHVMPLDAYFQQIIYTSTDTDILQVSENGLVKAINAGTAKILITDYLSKFTIEKEIVVYPVNTLEVHTETPFKGALAPAEEVVLIVDKFGKLAANANVTFTSSNDNVLVVNSDGKVTGVADGTAVVTIESVALGEKIEMAIMVKTENPNAQGVDQLLDLLIDNHMNIIETGNVCLYNDGRQKVFTPTYGSVNRYLFDEFKVDTTYYATSEANPNNHKVRRTGAGYDDSIYFVTVHDTATLTGTVVSIASGMSSGETSIHYTVGNDAIYGVVPEEYIAYHAGDGTGTTFKWTKTNAVATDASVAPEYDVVKDGDTFYLTCNGVQTTIEVPMMGDAEPDKDRYTILGPVWKVEDGYYYVGGPLWYSYSQIGTRGGNNNSIGIEMCVNYSSDVYDTWQRTAQLVADICLRNNLDTTRVKMHNTWSGKNCPQCLIEGNYWWEFMEMVELQYTIQKDFAGAEISIESHNPEILDNTGRIIAQPQKTTVVSYNLTVSYGGETRTVTLSSVVTGTTCWEQWDGTYVASTVWNEGKYNRY